MTGPLDDLVRVALVLVVGPFVVGAVAMGLVLLVVAFAALIDAVSRALAKLS